MTSTTPNDAPRASSLLILFSIVIAIYIGTASRPALLDDADGCHALAAREILQRNDWTVLYVNGIRWIEKPPLHYWLVAGSYGLFGQSALATRLPLALAMVALVLLMYDFGRRFFSERAGFYAGLAMGTSAGVFLFTRIMIPEALLALEFAAAFYLFLRAWTGSLPARIGWWGYAAIVGLATLTRAGIGALFPLAVVAIFIACAGGWRRHSEARRRLAAAPLLSSLAVALIVALPWHVLAALRVRGFLWFYFVNEQVLRAVGHRYPADYAAVPLWLWLGAHLIWFFPWSFFLPSLAAELKSLGTRQVEQTPSDPARLLLLVWTGVVFLFFSVVSGSRMEYYSFGAWPAVALLLAVGLARAEQARRRWLVGSHGVLALVGVIAAVVLGGLIWASREVAGGTDISNLLERHDANFYRVSMATLLDLTPRAFAALRTPAAVAAVLLLFGTLAALWLRRQGRHWPATLTLALMMVGFCHAANLAFQVFEPRLSSRPLADQVRGRLQAGDRLVVYGEFEQACSFSFYTDQVAWIYNGRYNGLEFGSHFPDAPDIFLDDRRFAEIWEGAERVFLFVPPEQRTDALARVPESTRYIVAEVGGKTLFANRATGLLSQPQPSLQNLNTRAHVKRADITD
jgi:4-amino-4-deoxy-L-arabinose transferase-like glycosyltransferase